MEVPLPATRMQIPTASSFTPGGLSSACFPGGIVISPSILAPPSRPGTAVDTVTTAAAAGAASRSRSPRRESSSATSIVSGAYAIWRCVRFTSRNGQLTRTVMLHAPLSSSPLTSLSSFISSQLGRRAPACLRRMLFGSFPAKIVAGARSSVSDARPDSPTAGDHPYAGNSQLNHAARRGSCAVHMEKHSEGL